jgi:glycosyltransferase involved in cell wall biosynthesis
VPLIVHVHSLEYDRAGDGGDERIEAIERAGLEQADAIVAVSHYTRALIERRYGIDGSRIRVVHNGVYAPRTVAAYRRQSELPGPMVLFLGRVTFQKGPDYFVEAAAKLAARMPTVHFVMAGSGDMLPQLKERVRELGLSGRFRFPGFVRGPEVERMFSTADVFVMPSVSEPFGLTALEAISFETPVILSRQSGASEVLRHALKIDFWDVDRLAERIESLLTYPELRQSIVSMARDEVRRIHWGAAAELTLQLYRDVISPRVS